MTARTMASGAPITSDMAQISTKPTAAPTHGIHHGISQMRRSMTATAANTTTSHR